jgi:type II secretory pathway predicted ATPase ExeA
LVGREALVDEFAESIGSGPGAPGRLTIFTGPRGVGKTVMLNAVAERAQTEYQWLSIHETATPGLLERIAIQAASILEERSPSARKITGVTLAGIGGVSLSEGPVPHELGVRHALAQLAAQLEEHGTGLLVTIDEIHAGRADELKQLAAVVQHLVREEREIALALAGLPQGVSALLAAESVATFLRRAERHSLGALAIGDVMAALRKTIEEAGRTISEDSLGAAAQATGGYPFMVQLVGYQVWRQASGAVITREAVDAGVVAARRRLEVLVHETALKDLSPVDQEFLRAMARDPIPSRTADIAARLGQSASYVAVYRARLLKAGLIKEAGRGAVDFALPFLREYLREHPEGGPPEDGAGAVRR